MSIKVGDVFRINAPKKSGSPFWREHNAIIEIIKASFEPSFRQTIYTYTHKTTNGFLDGSFYQHDHAFVNSLELVISSKDILDKLCG